MKKIQISPSILSADFSQLGNEIKRLEEGGADMIHVDVMDGHFVKNLTFGPPLIKALKKVTQKTLDVHLMISNPEETAFQYVEAGADYLTVHIEALKEPESFLENLKARSVKVGLSIKPNTPIEKLKPFLTYLDLILVMSVEPGFGGQAFIESSFDKVKSISNQLQNSSLKDKVILSVDGGVSSQNAHRLISSGANCLVAGSFLYKSDNRLKAVQSLKKNP